MPYTLFLDFAKKTFNLLFIAVLHYVSSVQILIQSRRFPLIYFFSAIIPGILLWFHTPVWGFFRECGDAHFSFFFFSYIFLVLLGYACFFFMLFLGYFCFEVFYTTTYTSVKHPGTGLLGKVRSSIGALSQGFYDIFYSALAISIAILLITLSIFERLIATGLVSIDSFSSQYGLYQTVFCFFYQTYWQAPVNLPTIFTDPLSLLFVILTMLLMPVCVTVIARFREEGLPLLFLGVFVSLLSSFAFLTTNFFSFFIAFEFVLLPMFFIIGQWGSRSERTVASYMLYLYTLVGSIFFLLILLVFVRSFSDCNYFRILWAVQFLSNDGRLVIWFLLFFGFAFKIPLFPLHSWLTSAHVEAPTIGSILLAGILLKLGGYGLMRYTVVLFPDITQANRTFVLSVCMLGLWYASICAYRQLDIKRFIAFTSIAHMQFLVASLFGGTAFGYVGAVHGMFSHGVIAAGLFFLVGSLYERMGVRTYGYISGILQTQPVFSTMWCLFLMANAGIPLLSGFPSEFLGFISIICGSSVLALFGIVSFILCGGYSFFGQVRLTCGSPTIWQVVRFAAPDISRSEFFTVLFLAVWSFILGIWPDVVCATFDKANKILPFAIPVLPEVLPRSTELRMLQHVADSCNPFEDAREELVELARWYMLEFKDLSCWQNKKARLFAANLRDLQYSSSYSITTAIAILPFLVSVALGLDLLVYARWMRSNLTLKGRYFHVSSGNTLLEQRTGLDVTQSWTAFFLTLLLRILGIVAASFILTAFLALLLKDTFFFKLLYDFFR